MSGFGNKRQKKGRFQRDGVSNVGPLWLNTVGSLNGSEQCCPPWIEGLCKSRGSAKRSPEPRMSFFLFFSLR